jgi:hypothetical protein
MDAASWLTSHAGTAVHTYKYEIYTIITKKGVKVDPWKGGDTNEWGLLKSYLSVFPADDFRGWGTLNSFLDFNSVRAVRSSQDTR